MLSFGQLVSFVFRSSFMKLGTSLLQRQRNGGTSARPFSTSERTRNLRLFVRFVHFRIACEFASQTQETLTDQGYSGGRTKIPPPLYPRVDESGTLIWPSKDEIERLLVTA
jgi:hypothetical protein